MSLYRFAGAKPEVHDSSFVHPSATILGEAYISSNCSIWPSATLRADSNAISLDKRSNVQDNAVIHVSSDHRAEIGRMVTIGHGAIVHGCMIEDEVVIGMNATVLSGAEIGEGSIVAAGAVVSEGEVVPPNSVVMGVPAELKREATEDDRAWIVENAREYVRKAKTYMKTMELVG